MNKTHTLRNWTILPVEGVTPNKAHACEGMMAGFVRLMGNTDSYRKIHARWERASESQCCIVEPVDILSSEIVEVHNRLDDSNGVSVTCRSGSVYRLEGEPRPSFKRHLRAFGLEFGPNSVAELVDALNNRGTN